MADVSFDQVFAGVRAWVEAGQDEPATVAGVYWALAKVLGVDTSRSSPGRIGEGDRFWGQCRRALDKMADAGELVKTGGRARGPGAGRGRSDVTYYTPAQYAAEQNAAARASDEARQVRAAWGDVHDQLAAAGVTAASPRGDRIRLSLGEWQNLVKVLTARTWPGNEPGAGDEQ